MATSPKTLVEDLVRAVGMRQQGRCAVGGGLIRGERGRDWSLHHRLPRGMGGTKTSSAIDADYLLVVCGSGTTGCHGWLESHRAEAYRLGYLLRHTTPPTDPTTVPVIRRAVGCVTLK